MSNAAAALERFMYPGTSPIRTRDPDHVFLYERPFLHAAGESERFGFLSP